MNVFEHAKSAAPRTRVTSTAQMQKIRRLYRNGGLDPKAISVALHVALPTVFSALMRDRS
jgi:hypothetical protein